MKIPKRIVYLTFDFLEPIFSGNGTLSRARVMGLLDWGYKVLVICPNSEAKDPQINKWVKEGSLQIMRIPIVSTKNLVPSCDWRGFHSQGDSRMNEITQFNPHIVVNPDWHTIDLAIKIKTNLSIPLVSQFFRIFSYFKEYISNIEDYAIIRKKEKDLVSKSDLIITLSQFDQKWCMDQGAVNVQISYPPLSKEFIHLLYMETHELTKKTAQTNPLITVSRLVPEKNILRIFPILKELEKLGVNFSYNLIGESLDKQYEKKVAETIGQLNLLSKIRILGRIPLQKMIDCLRTHPIYIHTSSYEPFGITISEAAAAGCIVVLDQDGLIGAKEWLSLYSDKEKMVQIDYSDPKNAAKTIHKLIKSINKDNQNMIDSRLVSKLDPKQYIETLVNLFRDFL